MHEPILLWCRRNNGASRTADSLCGWWGRSLPKQRETHTSVLRRETLTPLFLLSVDHSSRMMDYKRQSFFFSLHPAGWQPFLSLPLRIYAGPWSLHPKGHIKHNLGCFTMGWHEWKLFGTSIYFLFRIMNHAEYKLGNIVPLLWFNEFGGKDTLAMTARREKR